MAQSTRRTARNAAQDLAYPAISTTNVRRFSSFRFRSFQQLGRNSSYAHSRNRRCWPTFRRRAAGRSTKRLVFPEKRRMIKAVTRLAPTSPLLTFRLSMIHKSVEATFCEFRSSLDSASPLSGRTKGVVVVRTPASLHDGTPTAPTYDTLRRGAHRNSPRPSCSFHHRIRYGQLRSAL